MIVALGVDVLICDPLGGWISGLCWVIGFAFSLWAELNGDTANQPSEEEFLFAQLENQKSDMFFYKIEHGGGAGRVPDEVLLVGDGGQ